MPTPLPRLPKVLAFATSCLLAAACGTTGPAPTAQDTATADTAPQGSADVLEDTAQPGQDAAGDASGAQDTSAAGDAGGAQDAEVVTAPDVASQPSDTAADTPVADTAAADAKPACAQAVLLPGKVQNHALSVAVSGQTAQGQPVLTRKWTFQGPIGPQPKLSDEAAAQVTLGPLVTAGDYQVCVQVTAAGQPACAPTCATYAWTPGLYVQLTWETPGAANPQGLGAADLNLHLAHEKASGGKDLDCDGKPDPWFDALWDAHWFNPTPTWGTVPAADPYVHDAPNPSEPEVLFVELPAPGTYTMAVHALNDKGGGPSLATVRIFQQGGLLAEVAGVTLAQSELWPVARLQVAQGGAIALQSCKQSGDSCLGGKLWQPQGEVCKVPCYEFAGLLSKPTPGCEGKWK